jgi:hypothetical protein
VRLDFLRSFDGECSFERDAGGFASREMSRGACLRAMDARRFKRDRPPNSHHHCVRERGELFFFDWINELKTLGFGS